MSYDTTYDQNDSELSKRVSGSLQDRQLIL